MKVLIATDLTPGSQAVIDAVNARPWPAGSEACVLHVVDLTAFPVGAELLESARQGAASAIKKFVVEKLAPSGLKIRADVFAGPPRSDISDYAKKWGADLVMVGSHGGTGIARFLLGSVAQSVVRTAPCPVEIVRAKTQGPSGPQKGFKILLATDGSDCSTKAAQSIAARPWPEGACVKVISAVPPFIPIADATTSYFYAEQAILAAENVEKAGRSRAAEAIARACDLLKESRVLQIEQTEPLLGDPKHVILDEAAQWGADLIVVGSHGRKGFDRLMMGSVSEAVAMHARCSVEVIR